MFPHPHYTLPPLFISLNVEQTFAITTVWTRRPARYPAVATWSVCVPPGLRETSVRWTSVFDATELPASLMRRRAMWFASECFLSPCYSCSSFLYNSGMALKSSSFTEKYTVYIFMFGPRCCTHRVDELILYYIWNILGHTPYTNYIFGNVSELEVRWTLLIYLIWILRMFDKTTTEWFLLLVKV